ncbi:hypothetical protein DFS33DRAFT_1279168 [Desarmillaria ectypa]|nr:hypothetical protein DFS33DRAFT_1279168 [Desarmillaria ectypa]
MFRCRKHDFHRLQAYLSVETQELGTHGPSFSAHNELLTRSHGHRTRKHGCRGHSVSLSLILDIKTFRSTLPKRNSLRGYHEGNIYSSLSSGTNINAAPFTALYLEKTLQASLTSRNLYSNRPFSILVHWRPSIPSRSTRFSLGGFLINNVLDASSRPRAATTYTDNRGDGSSSSLTAYPAISPSRHRLAVLSSKNLTKR